MLAEGNMEDTPEMWVVQVHGGRAERASARVDRGRTLGGKQLGREEGTDPRDCDCPAISGQNNKFPKQL